MVKDDFENEEMQRKNNYAIDIAWLMITFLTTHILFFT